MLINKNDKSGSLFQISDKANSLIYYDDEQWYEYMLYNYFTKNYKTGRITEMLINDNNNRLYNSKCNNVLNMCVPIGIIIDNRTLKYSPYHNQIYRFTIGEEDGLGDFKDAEFILYVADTFRPAAINNYKL